MSQKLDRARKYEGLGLKWGFMNGSIFWGGRESEGSQVYRVTAHEAQMQSWLDAGHIRPVVETKIVRVEGVQIAYSDTSGLWVCTYPNMVLPQGAISRPVPLEFEVTP